MADSSMFDRPVDSFSLAERRIELSALAGPMRFLHGSGRDHTVAAAATREVAQNRGGGNYALYVELRAKSGFAAPMIIVGPAADVSPTRAITVDLSVQPFKFAYVLLPGERLFVNNPQAQGAVVFLSFETRV
jgi:hypothetical protein